MKVIVAGAGGLVGRALLKKLTEKGHIAVALNRRPVDGFQNISWDNLPAMKGDVLINLCGATINRRWNASAKKLLYSSRIEPVTKLLTAVKTSGVKTFFNISAAGFYGTSDEKVFTESDPAGNDFLAKLCSAWETEAHKARGLGVKVIIGRLAVVLSKDGGALSKMALPIRAFAGFFPGTGRQPLPWIHMDDAAAAIVHIIEKESAGGIYNLAAPQLTDMESFYNQLCAVLNRPCWLGIPESLMKLLMGEMSMLVCRGQNISAQRLIDSGFTFTYPKCLQALQAIYKK